MLYATAAALVAAGAAWWVVAAPEKSAGSPTDRWRGTAERLLPDDPLQQDGGTETLGAGADQQVGTDLPVGSYLVSVLCVGGAGSTVRVALSEGGNDSGLGLSCEGEPSPDSFPVALADGLRMTVTVSEGAGPVVFRYIVTKRPG